MGGLSVDRDQHSGRDALHEFSEFIPAGMARRVEAGLDFHFDNTPFGVTHGSQTDERHAKVLHPIPQSE